MKKRVLIFIEDGSFTYDNRVIREADALTSAGWDVIVISPKYPNDPYYKKIGDNLRAYYYPKSNTKSALGHVFEHTLSMIFGSALTLWVSLKHGFDVFHACNPMDILWMIALPYKAVGKKFIFDQHDLCPELFLSRDEGDVNSFFYKILILLERFSFKYADAVIATNESYKEVAIQRGGKKAEEVFVVRNGPDLKKFKKVPAKESLKKESQLLVGYIGNMNLQDGVDYLLRAAEEIIINRKRNDLRFIFIGGGSHQPYLKRKSKEMNLADYVLFTGRIDDDEMLAILNACDICVQPDPFNPLNDKSTMNKVMEYMAIEKPVVAFDLKETRVSCESAALYVAPNNVMELADKIIFLAENEDIRSEMGRIGNERIKNMLSWDYSVPKLINTYGFVSR